MIESEEFVPVTALKTFNGQYRRTNFVENDGHGWIYEYQDNPLRRLLRVTFCDSLPFPSIDQDRLFTYMTRSLLRVLPPSEGEYFTQARIFINGSAGFRFSGIPFMWNDGHYTGTHNVYENDADICVALPTEEMFRRVVEGSAMQLLEEDAIPFSHETYLRGKAPWHNRYSASKYTRVRYEWSQSPWFPSYLKMFFKYYQKETHSIDIHHISSEGNFHQEMIRRFVPCYSTVAGYPMYEGFIDRNGDISHTIWQPFELEQGQHQIRISDPEFFAADEASLIKLPRIPLFAVQIGVAMQEPAIISGDSIEVMREVVARAKHTLTERRRASNQRRYATCRYRAGISDSINTLPHTKYFNRDTRSISANYVEYVLNKTGWSDLIFGEKLPYTSRAE